MLGGELRTPSWGSARPGCSSDSAHRMDDEEDDVFEPDPSCWRTTFREIKCEDRGTQTPGPALVPHSGMLPCGVAEEPRPLFYARFELIRDLEARQQDREEEPNRMERLPRQLPVARSLEVCIGQKLQLIGDQFHREHLQQYHRNQRNQGPLWWRLTAALLSLLFDRGFIAGGGGAGRR
ncbi:bcl-2-modifying factor isoform X2 [Kryptolebias marmoratus]|uniref:bcl-2-modifying factor isoform X2 n=1 Tax=Kryptolebias marmoratus TaxID=37003 RepID=UPI0018ACF824|nr:bcl-2-modifying factor isoform X2 [Kryptolebias marmoratus]